MLEHKLNKGTIKISVLAFLSLVAMLSTVTVWMHFTGNKKEQVDLKEANLGDVLITYDNNESTVVKKDLSSVDNGNKEALLSAIQLVWRDSEREYLMLYEVENTALDIDSVDDILAGYYQEQDAKSTNIYGLESNGWIITVESYGTYVTSCGAQVGADFTIAAYPKEWLREQNKKCYIGVMSYIPDDETIFNETAYNTLIEAFVRLTDVDINKLPDFDKTHETLKEQYEEYLETLESLMG